MPPSQRVRLLVKHLHGFGWQPVILTVDHYYREELADPWMLEIMGNHYEKIDVGCLDQRKTRKFGIGDLGIRMLVNLFFVLKKETKKRKPDIILYPVPPWYIMVLAPIIKSISGIPFAIDFIDPWVHSTQKKGFKAKMSQWIARRCEGFVVKKSSAVFAVSQGILDTLVERYPSIKNIPLVAVPYGVEFSDFDAIKVKKPVSGPAIIRYIGAISEAMLPVVDTLIKALFLVQKRTPIVVEFTGTNYAGAGLVKPLLTELISKNMATGFITENPARVDYRQALELGMSATMQLLIGDTTPYYAASKMMGMAASGQSFFAVIHKKSFPAAFLNEVHFENKFEFETEKLAENNTIEQLANAFYNSIINRHTFKAIPTDNYQLQQYSAYAMTKIFSDTLKKIINE